MIGRYVAGLIAVVSLVLLPVKYKGLSLAEREENAVQAALDETFAKIRSDGRITLEHIEALRAGIAISGIPHDIEIEVGTVLVGKSEKVITVRYTEEIMAELTGGGSIDVRHCLVSITADPLRTSFGEALANMFWDSYVPVREKVSGGYIYG